MITSGKRWPHFKLKGKPIEFVLSVKIETFCDRSTFIEKTVERGIMFGNNGRGIMNRKGEGGGRNRFLMR